MNAPLPPNETQRLQALRESGIMDTPAEREFDDLTALAAEICGAPIALIALVDESRQWFKSKVGMSATETAREVAFCAHALDGSDLLIVPDAREDPRFADNPLVTGDPMIRFYAGAPLISDSGHVLGSLCVIDRKPRHWSEQQARALRVLSDSVSNLIRLRHHRREQERLERELHGAMGEEKRTETVLRESEADQRRLAVQLASEKARLVQAQAVAKVGSWETDLATMDVIWSEETHRIFETEPGRFSPTHAGFLNFVHPDDREAVDAAFRQSIERPDAQAIEHRIVTAGGRSKFVDERWQVYCDTEGKAVRAIGTCQDITDRKRAQEERDRMFNLSLDLLSVIGFDGRFQQVNPAWTTCLGWTKEELVGRPFADFVHPEDRALTRGTDQRIIRGQLAMGFQNRYRCKDGSYRWLSWNSHPLPESGQVFSVARDVTAQVRNEEERRLLAACLSRLNDMVVIAEAGLIEEPGPRILYVNEAFVRRTGYAREEVMGRSPRFLQGPKTDRAALDRIRAALQKRQPVREEVINYARDGEEYWVELDIVPVADAEGLVSHMVAIQRDITGRKQADQEKQQTNEILADVVKVLQEVAALDASLPEVMKLMAARALDLTQADGGLVELLEGEEIVYSAGAGLTEKAVGWRLPLDGSLTGWSMQGASAQICEDTETDDRVNRAVCRQLGIRSMVVAPLREGPRFVGALKVVSTRPRAFAPRDAGNLQILVESLGVIMQRQRAMDQLRSSEEQYRLLFANNPLPMWAYDLETLRFIAVNEAAVRRYGYTAEEFLAMKIWDIRPREDFEKFEQALLQFKPAEKIFGRWRHQCKDGSILEVETSSDGVVLDGRPARLVLANDITERVRAEREAARATRALLMLSRCNEAVVRASNEDDLIKSICEIATEVGGFRMAWVGYAMQDAKRSLVPRVYAGLEAGYLSEIRLSWADDDPAGRGPASRAVRTAQTVVVPDLLDPAAGFVHKEEAAKRGYRGLVCLPIREGGKSLGVLVLYLAEVVNLPPDELTLLQELADDLAFGIITLRARAERRLTHEAVLTMARGISAAVGADFFRQLTQSMVQALGAFAGFIAKIDVQEPGRARTLCAVQDGKIVPNFVYEMAGLPCEHPDGPELLVIEQDAWRRHPQSRLLVENQIEAFVGARLVDAQGKAVGLMFVHFKQPLARSDFVTSTLRIFASRAASEIQRQAADAVTSEQAALLDKAQDAIIVRGLDHRITYWNKSAERIYGWTKVEALGRSVRELLYADSLVYDRANEQLLAKGDWVGELNPIGKGGKKLTIEGHWTLLRDEEGRPKSVLAISTDVTERKKLEQQFLRAQRMESIGTLAGGIAHDLNNLLAPITMGIDLLRQTAGLSSRDSLVLDNIKSSADRGANLVKQVLSFARGFEGAKVSLQIRHVIREVESIMENTFPKNIAIEAEVDADLALVEGDPTQLNQVLLNLCVNARDAMPNGGRLVLKAHEAQVDGQYAAMNESVAPGRFVVIEVIDTGAGMAKEVIDRIFEPFFTTKEFGKGTGLGLATVMGITRGHGGFVNVYSEPGKGSTFKVYLPAQTGGVEPVAVRPAEDELPRGQGELVLLVDDEKSIRDVTQRTLEDHGYRVVTAEDGAQAINCYAEHHHEVAVVLTDIMMPVMDGVALSLALRRLNPRIRIIAASGLNTNGQVARTTNSTMNHFLAKPYSAADMLKTIKLVLAEKSAPESNRSPA